jgi:pilus assembly protein Flp/PilA
MAQTLLGRSARISVAVTSTSSVPTRGDTQFANPSTHWSARKLRMFLRFLKDERAATAIEYGLITAGIALLIIGTVNGLGLKLKGTFSNISANIK